jgi:hypothetical protein
MLSRIRHRRDSTSHLAVSDQALTAFAVGLAIGLVVLLSVSGLPVWAALVAIATVLLIALKVVG